MCGLTGFIDTTGRSGEADLRQAVRRMADTIVHRGPDDSGEWADPQVGLALGFRRLAIVDLSPEGHQPMASAGGRYVIAFNGEVYNFRELRRELEEIGQAPAFRGHSDTEVMLAAIEAWGLERAVKKFVGMFAFALWDRKERTLHLVRDRLGIKPMYYGWIGGTFLFGSELKTIRAHPGVDLELNRDAVTLYLRYNYVPAPHSIYEGIYKLPPGSYLTLPCGERGLPEPTRYWSALEAAERGVRSPFTGTEEEAVEQLDALLRESVRLRMVADVPLGAFLSGGVDSSTVVGVMQALSDRPVRTFTIGFHEEGYNEAEHAKAVARHLGTEHTELYVTPEEAMAVIPKLPLLYDEPFSDSSQIPTYLVSELARRHVTVSLSGDGGDELFAGYNRYFWWEGIWKRIGKYPPAMRQMIARGITAASPRAWDRTLQAGGPLVPRKLKQPLFGDKLHKLAGIIPSESPEALYSGLLSHWKRPDEMVLGSREPATLLTDPSSWPPLGNFISTMQYLDTVSYLPDDILVKVDRASMGVSLEARVPLLDHRVVEFAWRIPLSMKVQNGEGKALLRKVLYRYVPKEIIERPKMGFGVPIDRWLREDLRDWAEALLDERRLREEGIFDPGPIRRKWSEHLAGHRNWHNHLWLVLMFQAWWEEHRSSRRSPVTAAVSG
jgi:asparagine synthase (glutamine-hydrolysing)